MEHNSAKRNAIGQVQYDICQLQATDFPHQQHLTQV